MDTYNLILGCNLMQEISLNLIFSSGQFKWGDIRVSMVNKGFYKKQGQTTVSHWNPNTRRLNDNQKNHFLWTLTKHEGIFQGTLGAWCSLKINVELKDGAQPFHAKPYCLLHAILPVFKKEVDCLVNIGVISPNSNLEWAALSLISVFKSNKVTGMFALHK